ncbi:PREDICTED: fatty acid-binding protein, liver isoform X2 [Thamnophis sirtalis]|uniref:Fatty acid-binding protein, liver isoform X2 n=1 Tax=Thamnophis sirtalis TaxID=35019 RepID=A0A6I9YJE3_9SAUR|nr:PREDICTED: fatty acid-binding protein, liver isoform X2 [Thamnophis sirtalis]
MAFDGTWQVYTQEKYEDFLKAIALSDDIIKIAKDIKPITEIHQTGNTFVITTKNPNKSVTNTFLLGKEAEMTTMDGKKVKCTVNLTDGKLIAKSDKFIHEQQIVGNEMVEAPSLHFSPTDYFLRLSLLHPKEQEDLNQKGENFIGQQAFLSLPKL